MDQHDLNKEFENLMHDSFTEYKVEADDYVWENIQKELNQDKKRRIVWWRYATAASVALLLTVGAFYWSSQTNDILSSVPKNEKNDSVIPLNDDATKKNKDQSSSDKKVNTDVPSDNTTSIAKNTASISAPSFNESSRLLKNDVNAKLAKDPSGPSSNTPASPGQEIARNESSITNSPPSIANNPTITPELTSNHKQKENEVISATAATTVEEQENVQQASMDQDEKAEALEIATNDTPAEMEPDSTPAITIGEIDLGITYEDPIIETQQHQRLFLAANVNSNQGGDEDSFLNFDNGNKGEASPLAGLNDKGFESFEYQFDTVSRFSFSERSFLPPIMASITVNYSFHKRWSIESGVSYSLLSAIRQTTKNSDVNIEQTEQLHYVGIPFLLNYNFVTGKKVTLFLSTGTVINKGVSYVNKFNFKNGEADNLTTKEGIDGIKYVVYIGMGAEYRLTPRIGVFLQPGVSYFDATKPQPFDIAGSSSSGLQPNLRFGLRFHLGKNN